MIICGLDFETSGEDPTANSVVEVGAVLWETELRRPVRSIGYLVYDRAAVWQEGTTEINGITQDQCASYGIDNEAALKRLISYYRMANVICTHNGTAFDRIFYENWCERFGYVQYKNQGKVWIDTKIDIPFPNTKWHNLNLKHLAAEHGILHAHAHGALPDANVMLQILDMYDFNKVMESAMSPTVIVQAIVAFEDKDKAKAQGYYWRPATRQWVKAVKACRIEEEVLKASQVGFSVKIGKESTIIGREVL